MSQVVGAEVEVRDLYVLASCIWWYLGCHFPFAISQYQGWVEHLHAPPPWQTVCRVEHCWGAEEFLHCFGLNNTVSVVNIPLSESGLQWSGPERLSFKVLHVQVCHHSREGSSCCSSLPLFKELSHEVYKYVTSRITRILLWGICVMILT